MMNLLKRQLSQKVFFPLWVVLIIFSLVDITTRLTDYEIKNNDNWQMAELDEESTFALNEEQAKRIITAIDAFQVPTETASSASEGMSAAEQLAQQGDLGQLFAGDIRYRLVGVFDKK